jgi:hypothetical protein
VVPLAINHHRDVIAFKAVGLDIMRQAAAARGEAETIGVQDLIEPFFLEREGRTAASDPLSDNLNCLRQRNYSTVGRDSIGDRLIRRDIRLTNSLIRREHDDNQKQIKH